MPLGRFTKPAPVGFFERKKPAQKTSETERLTGTFFSRVGWADRNPGKPVFFATEPERFSRKPSGFFGNVNPARQSMYNSIVSDVTSRDTINL